MNKKKTYNKNQKKKIDEVISIAKKILKKYKKN